MLWRLSTKTLHSILQYEQYLTAELNVPVYKTKQMCFQQQSVSKAVHSIVWELKSVLGMVATSSGPVLANNVVNHYNEIEPYIKLQMCSSRKL